MRPIILKLSFLLLLITLAPIVYGQSFGDPVIYETFGSGTGAGAPLPSDITNYAYTNNQCPADGGYTIANSTNGCFTNTWHTLSRDHTGNANGYMMIINASSAPGVFYVQKAEGSKLCPNTTYEFAAWVLNILKNSSCGTGAIKPNITFSIETTSGQVLKTYETGDIEASATPAWNQYATEFTTPVSTTDIVVKMTNKSPGGCGNDLVLDDITFRAKGPVLTPAFTAGNSSSQSLCQGDNANYTISTGVSAGYSNPNFQWQQSLNNSAWTDITGKITSNLKLDFTNAQPGSYQYRLAVGDGPNINSLNCRTYSTPLTIIVGAKPVAQVNADQSECEGNAVQLTASGGVTYEWTGPNGYSSTTQNPVISNINLADAGTYSVIAISAQQCRSLPAQTNIQVVPKPAGTVSGDVNICEGTSTTLTASGGTKYSWSPALGLSDAASATPLANPVTTTTYTVKVINDLDCFDEKIVTVTVMPKAVANAGEDKKIFEGQSVKLDGATGGGSVTHYWTPADYLDDPNSLTPIASPVNDITYTLHVTADNGCGSAHSPVFVKVYKKVTVPNTFSPNADGINDTWNIDALITYPDCLVSVYNRYGNQVYQSRGYGKAWNGSYNGRQLPTGTYYYIIDLKNGTPKINGWIVIVR
jgi:gliding motility-associated-like protein